MIVIEFQYLINNIFWNLAELDKQKDYQTNEYAEEKLTEVVP